MHGLLLSRLNASQAITSSEASVINSDIIVDGQSWCRRFGKLMLLSFYVKIKGEFSSYNSYNLFKLSKKASFDVKGIVMTQTDGVSHVVEIGNQKSEVNLAIKGESISPEDWIWGYMMIPTAEK